MAKKWDFRDVSIGLQKLRNFLLGRKHTLHVRYPPLISPRTLPPADIPRGPEYKYSDQYYYRRCALHSVKPPVVAPYPSGKCAGTNPLALFAIAPAPGTPWGWDGHCYYETVPESASKCPPDPPKCDPGPPKCPPPAPPKPCAPPKPICPPPKPKCPPIPPPEPKCPPDPPKCDPCKK